MLKKYFRWRYLVVYIFALVLILELAVRFFGLIDFPIINANNSIGYIPAPNQKGKYLRRNDWEFNSLSMGAKEFVPEISGNILLIGDSLVYGGNQYSQQQKIGPQLANRINLKNKDWGVWPIGAGSWALLNELEYLHQNRLALLAMDKIVFVLNSGDFDMASSWSCEATHPTKAPAFGLLYLINKFVFSFESCGQVKPENMVPPKDLEKELKSFIGGSKSEILAVLYPTKLEFEDPALYEKKFQYAKELLARNNLKYIEVKNDSKWMAALYKDDIHPTIEGNTVLADVIYRALFN